MNFDRKEQELSIQLFDLIKKHKWNEFIYLIKNTKNIDVNIKDHGGNTLLQYAILPNQKEIIQILLEHGAVLDNLDVEGKSILYLPIKYNYLEIMDLILSYNKTQIGISVTNILDHDGNSPIFYALEFHNLSALQLLLKYQVNLNQVNSKGDTVLNTAIRIKDQQITELILSQDLDINAINIFTGDSALHVASSLDNFMVAEKLIKEYHMNVNIKNIETESTPLMNAILLHQNKLVNLLLEQEIKWDIQDILGNTVLHYCVREESYVILEKIIKKLPLPEVINICNLTNIEGMTALHILFFKPLADFDQLNKYIKSLLQYTSVNIQDYSGNTILHFLTKNKIWNQYQDLLKIKKMDIYIKNNKKLSPLNYLPKSEQPKFIQFVENSYLIVLQNRKDIWQYDWENKCHKPSQKENCLEQIKKHFLKNKISYPKTRLEVSIKLEDYPATKFVFYTGTSIDSLSSLLYLLKKYKKNTYNILDQSFISNPELDNYYHSYHVSNVDNFSGIEIEWAFYKIFFPIDLVKKVTYCLLAKTKRFIIIPLHIMLRKGGHSNYLIYDTEKNEVERFEPHGSNAPVNFDYKPEILDQILQKKFFEINSTIKYISPATYLPRIGFQLLEGYEKKQRHLGDPGGFCESWSVWYTNTRLLNPHISRSQLVKLIVRKIRNEGASFKNMIRNFAGEITRYRDEFLKQVKLDINDWYYFNYTTKQRDKLVQLFLDEINTLK